MNLDVIYNKSCQRMEEVPDDSIDTILTSCPYWGLRNYGDDVKEIWGGSPDCEHEWGNDILPKGNKSGPHGPGSTIGAKLGQDGARRGKGSNFCQKCNAWQGQLGLEPTLEMYIDHLLIITLECKRVLKPTGVMWWNHGDSYFTGKGSCHNPGGGSKSWKSWNERKTIYPTGTAAPNRMSKEAPPKCLALQNYRLVIRMIDEQGWTLRNAAIWAKCLSGNTPIYARSQGHPLRSSVREIARLPLHKLYIAGSDGWRKVIRIERQPAKELLTIHLRNGMRIEVTPEHRFPVGNNLIVASQLKKGDQLKHTKFPNEVGTPLGNELVGWTVGFYLAEGSRTGKSIQFSINSKENDYANKLREFAHFFAGKYRKHIYGNNLIVVLSGSAITGIIREYVTGTGSRNKHLSNSVFKENNLFLKAILDGYLAGDGHYDHKNNRWRLGFTRNRELEWDLRTICTRLGYHMRAFLAKAKIGEREYPCIRGEIREKTTGHFNQKDDYEVLRITETRGITFDIEVDGNHVFALADGCLIHNSNSMPSSVKDRLANKYEPVFCLVKNTKPRYYWNEKTGLMADRKPPKDKQKEGIDWEWQEDDKSEMKKRTFWHNLGYWFDLDAIRDKHKETTINRQKYPVKANTQSGTLEKGRQLDEERVMKVPNPLGKNPGDIWTIPTQPRPEAHFATFPDRLCERPIKATCPQEICKKCGMPRVRISKVKSNYTKRESAYQPNNEPTKVDSTGWKPPNSKTIGWTDCGCNAGFEPGIVLDPFAGRGTTLIMAKKLGRHYVGYELKKEYCEKLIRPALEDMDPLFAEAGRRI